MKTYQDTTGKQFNSQAEAAQSNTSLGTNPATRPKLQTTPIDASILGNTTPYDIPKPTPLVPPNPPNLPAPTGTTSDANGNATIPPPTEIKLKNDSTTSGAYDRIKELMGIQATKADVTAQLQQEEQLNKKRQQATADYNAYTKAKLEQAQTIENMRTTNPQGLQRDAQQQNINDYSAKSNANLANLAVQAQVSQGLLSDAQQTIKDKIDTQFAPIQDEIDSQEKLISIAENDMSESEKLQANAMLDAKKIDNSTVQKTVSDLHDAALQNSAPTSVYSAMDKITQDFLAGNIDAQTAQTRLYQAVGQYGADKLKQAQLNNINSEIAKRNADARQALNTLPSAVQTRVQGIAGQFDSEQAVKNYQTIAETVDAVKNAGTSPTDDIQRVYAVAKVFDPNSAVREGEYKTVQDYATSLLQRAGLKANRVFNNDGFLTDEARKFINTSLDNRLSSSKKAYDNIYSSYGDRINKVTGKTDGKDYITDYSDAFKAKAAQSSKEDEDLLKQFGL